MYEYLRCCLGFDGFFTGFLTRKDVHIVSVNIYR